jgi:hypothetical protein
MDKAQWIVRIAKKRVFLVLSLVAFGSGITVLTGFLLSSREFAEWRCLRAFKEAAATRAKSVKMNGWGVHSEEIDPFWSMQHERSVEALEKYAWELGRLRSERSVKDLVSELKETPSSWHRELHRTILEALSAIGEPGLPGILEELKCHDDESGECKSWVHGELLRLLCTMGHSAGVAVPTVIGHARRSARGVTVYPNGAMRPMQEVFVLCHIADPPAPALLELVADDEAEILRYSAAAMLWRIGESVEAERALEILAKETQCSAVRERTGALLERIRAGERPPPLPTP